MVEQEGMRLGQLRDQLAPAVDQAELRQHLDLLLDVHAGITDEIERMRVRIEALEMELASLRRERAARNDDGRQEKALVLTTAHATCTPKAEGDQPMTIQIKVRANGPFIVDGEFVLVDEQGNEIEQVKKALCRCAVARPPSRSATAPTRRSGSRERTRPSGKVRTNRTNQDE
jgi:hypothetical protein